MQARHREFQLQLSGVEIKLSSNFDSGNLQSAEVKDGRLVVTPALDPMHPQYSIKQSSKAFFHFSIQAAAELAVPIVVRRMRILQYFASEEQFQEYYRVCVGRRRKRGGWLVEYEKVWLAGMRRVEAEGEFELHFSIKVEQQTYLAYHYPYPLEKNQLFLQDLKERAARHNTEHEHQIYLAKELLIESLEGRSVDLLTITSQKHMLEEEQSRVTKSIFPYYQMEGRPKKFQKPYVLITCRVHSGETSSSFALEGFLDFIVSEDKRAEVLRQNFVFLIVPMVNPDGVFHGTYRMDTLGHNLNRFYNSAQSHRQPAIFAIQALASYYSSRIVFFMDLHSHPHPSKGSFIYGNGLGEIEEQVESQLYAKILSGESECFGYGWSNFSTSQMNSRDVNELLTKDGSARVQVYKTLRIPFAYTMEMGYHGCPPKKRQEDEATSEYRRTEKVFTVQDYKSHGKSIALALLTLFQLGTANGIRSEQGRLYQMVREEIFKQLIEKQERFRQADSFVFRKLKALTELISNLIYQPIFRRFSYLQASLVDTKKTPAQKRNLIHTISENSSAKKGRSLVKKELSLNIRDISKTIDSSQQKALPSFRSAIDGSDSARFHFIDSRQDSYSFAKMLNLDFNPFPSTEKRRIYNILGNKRSSAKKTIISELEWQRLQRARAEHADTDSIDVHSQLQLAERSYKDTVRIVETNRNKVMSNFNTNHYLENEEEGLEYNDLNWEERNEEERFVLPKIAAADKTQQNFNVQLQIQREYDRKYKLSEHKDLAPHGNRGGLRSNALRVRSVVRTHK